MPQFIKQYSTPSGLVEIKITYQPGVSAELDFDVVEDIELGYGYEDEDQLTFYPNTCKLVFDDFKKTNYDTLKLSLGTYANTLPENKMTYGGVEIKLNGATKFKGYIDELTLNYDEDKLETSFEALDLTMQLRDMNVDRSKIIDTQGNIIPENSIFNIALLIWGIFKQIWMDLPPQLYNVSEINDVGKLGIFLKHDWVFKGEKTLTDMRTKYWNITLDFVNTLFNFDSTGMFSQNRPCRTWVDFLKLIALQFGAIVGVMDYGKVYFAKRFGLQTFDAIDVSNKIIDNNLIRTSLLHVLRGVVIKNHWNGERTFEFGNIERTPNSDYVFEKRVKTIDTYIGSFQDQQLSGTCIYVDNSEYPVFGKVWDPQLGGEISAGHCYQLLGRWQRENRKIPKDMVECTLEGIDYDMVTVHKITPQHVSPGPILFRPMTIKKSILKNETKITGVEV